VGTLWGDIEAIDNSSDKLLRFVEFGLRNTVGNWNGEDNIQDGFTFWSKRKILSEDNFITWLDIYLFILFI
jgi:hypothetical protein